MADRLRTAVARIWSAVFVQTNGVGPCFTFFRTSHQGSNCMVCRKPNPGANAFTV
ncbi:MAG: hypothetical protein ABSG37_00330 [Candidatus Limnocylindrales bacterium]